MPRYNWPMLNKQQVGTYFEYFVKMELTMFGFEVFTTEVDDRGIDFIARRSPGSFIEIQAKAIRTYNYVFMRKDHFDPRASLYVALGLLHEGREPESYLIPSTVWLQPNEIFVSRDYNKPGQKSAPEWGINMSMKNLPALQSYRFESTLKQL
ncbi:MAG: DUF4365 domain-containing protein [Nitrosomonas sp.]